MTLLQAHDLSIFADYFQFYVQDAETADDFAEGWTAETSEAMLVSKSTALGIGTARNMDVPVRLEVHDAAPHDPGGWDRQNQTTLALPSGRLQVMGCTDYAHDAFQAATKPGTYQVRISYFDLDKLSEDGLDGDDRYLVQLWPSLES